MPRYRYRCECGEEFIVEHGINERRETCAEFCPEGAGNGLVVKVPVTTGKPVLKGGGWAKDGYGR